MTEQQKKSVRKLSRIILEQMIQDNEESLDRENQEIKEFESLKR